MRKQIKVISLLILTVMFPTAVYAGSGEDMTKLLGVKLGKEMTLRDVVKRLGKSQIIESGDAGEYKATICYYVPKCQTKVEFWSDELGGSQHDVIGFTLTRKKKQDNSCPALNAACEDLRLANGMQLGMQRKEFIKRLGSGVKSVEGFYQKGFESRKPMSEEERRTLSKSLSSPVETGLFWDIVVFIRGAFSSGSLDILQVSRTQTF